MIRTATAFVVALVATVAVWSIEPAHAGNCDYSHQTAKDGSSCGNRAADRRPGGR